MLNKPHIVYVCTKEYINTRTLLYYNISRYFVHTYNHTAIVTFNEFQNKKGNSMSPFLDIRVINTPNCSGIIPKHSVKLYTMLTLKLETSAYSGTFPYDSVK